MAISEKQLRNLKKHEYQKEGTSILEPYFDVFWTWIVQFVPLWIAPNLITLLGSMTCAIQAGVMLHYTGFAATEIAPSWVYWTAALR